MDVDMPAVRSRHYLANGRRKHVNNSKPNEVAVRLAFSFPSSCKLLGQPSYSKG